MKSDPSAERAVLAGILQHGLDGYTEVADIVGVSSFYDENNAILFRCLQNVINQGKIPDIAAILSSASELGVSQVMSSAENLKYIKAAINYPSNIQNLRKEAIKLKKLETARDLKNLVKSVYDDLDNINGTESFQNIFSKAETPILDFTNGFQHENVPQKIGDNIDEYIDFLEKNKNRKIGISSGYYHYDNLIGGGFRRKTVSLIGARMKTGKSILADNIAIHTGGKLNVPTLMLDTEMTPEDHQNRMLSYFTKIDSKIIEEARFDISQLAKIKEATRKIKSLNYHYESVAGADFEDILGISRRWTIKEVGIENGRTNDCLIIYDYLKLMNSSKINSNMAEHQVLGFQISDLHNFAVKYDVPILSFVQLNRDGILKETTDVVSQSDRLLWLCTNFSIFKIKSYEEIEIDGQEYGNRKLIPLVSRHGPGIDDGNYINMHMQGEYAMICEGQLASHVRNETNRSFDTATDDEEL